MYLDDKRGPVVLSSLLIQRQRGSRVGVTAVMLAVLAVVSCATRLLL